MGENPLVIRDMLGRENIQITLGTYRHIYPNTNKEVAERLSNMISIPKNGAKRRLTGNQYVKHKG